VPLAAVIAAHVFYSHQPALAAGTILDGSVPAGVISNLLTFIAHGSVALAITLTFIHTLLSPLLTPALTSALASKYVVVNFVTLLVQLLQIVVAPVLLGWAIRYALGEQRIQRAERALPIMSTVLVYAVEMGLISHAAPAIRANIEWVPVVVAVTSMLTAVNLAVAYVLGKALRLSEREARAVMFDVGIYNSGLGAVLAGLNFGPLSVLPPMMNSVMNLIIGTFIASILHNYPPAAETEKYLAPIEARGEAK
jgi:BASS family bile acid:Na+ symporter